MRSKSPGMPEDSDVLKVDDRNLSRIGENRMTLCYPRNLLFIHSLSTEKDKCDILEKYRV